MPIEPPPTTWTLVRPPDDHPHDACGLGADLEPGTLLAAYRAGLFPMRVDGELIWWSPARRAVIPVAGFKASRSLRRAARGYEIRVDTAFGDVVRGCADPRRPHGWIDATFVTAYTRLHELGWAHSVEAWRDGELAGGLYGLAIGGLFAGESMFHHATDASKCALVGLCDLVFADGEPRRLIDVQWVTPHLASLGVVGVRRSDYVARLQRALLVPPPEAFER